MEFPPLAKLNRPLPWFLGILTGSIVLVGAATYWILETPSAEDELDQLTVLVEQQNLAVEIEASGKVEPIESVNISPKTPGRLAKLLVEQGYPVKRGQQLAIMENDEVRAQGVQAQARLKEAIAALKEAETRIPGEIHQAEARFAQSQARLLEAQQRIPRQIEQARAQLRSAEARFNLAQDRVKRNKYLIDEGAVAQDQFDEAINEFQSAQANVIESLQYLEQLKSTEFPEIETLKAEVSETKIALEQKRRSADAEAAQLTAATEAAQAELEMVKVQYRDTFIVAPFDGIVTQRYTNEGAIVTPTTSASSTASATSSSILAIARGLEIVAQVPEVDLGQLQPGQPVKIVAEAYPQDIFQGQVRRIAPEAVVEENVTSFEVTIALVSGQDKLRSKMNVDVTFLANPIRDALVVPTVAIVTQQGKTGVMIPDSDDQPTFHPVTIGLTLNDKTQILTGLLPGERVFIDLPEEAKETIQ